MSSLCRVCGGQGRCINYGALTCQACRAFFRRHGLRPKTIPPCPWNGQCDLNANKQKQTTCIACRLAKCLAVGMSPEYVRKSNRTKTLHKTDDRHEDSSFHHHSTFSTNQLDLTPTEWKSISNIVHAYDTFSVIPQFRDAIQSSDSDILSDILQPANMTEKVFNATQLFIRSIPDFQILTANEQDSLVQRNFKGLSALNSTYISRESCLSSDEQYNRWLLEMHGAGIAHRKDRLERQLDQDPILVKLILVVATFSSSLFALSPDEKFHQDSFRFGTFRLFGSQNIYVQLLWKYLMHRYNFHEAVIRYSQLVKQILDTILLINEICQKSEYNEEFVNSTFQKNRENFLQQQPFNNVPLWGYKQ